MKYKRMSEMTAKEIEFILHMVFRDVELTRFEYVKDTNFIKVYFDLPGENPYDRLEFLPDDIYLVCRGDPLDGACITQENIIGLYQQFMIAKGYSEIWLNNPFTE